MMKHFSLPFLILATAATIAGCTQPTSSPNSLATSEKTATLAPAKPLADADESAWFQYLAEQGRIHGDGIGTRPYIYVIPDGEDMASDTRRKDLRDAIVRGAGTLFGPGSYLIVGGPSAGATNAFVKTVLADVTSGGLDGVSMLVVSNDTEKESLTDVLAESGGKLRVAVM